MGLPWGCGIPSLTGHARGLLTSLVTLFLLRLGSAQLRVVGPDYPLTATMGQDVVLRCYLSPRQDARSLEVRWIRDNISETVHHYRNGEDLYGEQMGAYAGRTELVRDGLSAGSLDLRITRLRPSDDGRYICIVKDADAYDKATVDLEMSGAVIVTGSVEGPLSCVVRSSRLQQERESSLHISAPFFHNAQPWMVALALVLVLLAVSIGLGVYLFRKQVARIRELEKKAAELAWRKCLLPQNTVKITLDPHTAHPLLVVSKDHRSVRRESKSQQVHNSQDRFKYWCCVLGHEEFEEGRHCWEVEVEVEGELENESCWAVGVTRASVNKKEKNYPKNGIWALMYQQGQLMPLTSRIHLPLSPVPTRIWVCLDCTQQQVSFINADNGVEIYTFTAASFNGDSIRPWFLLETEGTQLCLKDSTPQTLSPALRGSCDSPATPASPLLGPAGAAQE